MAIITTKGIQSKTKVLLPGSKSISNRVLMISAVGNIVPDVKNLSKCDDVLRMNQILYSNSNSFNVGESGTALRFLTAMMSGIVGQWKLTGSNRILERPVKPLVTTLREMGANIDYVEKEGYAPLSITGTKMKGGDVSIDISESSQYASAILLVSPMCETGLKLKLVGEKRSMPYIDLTLDVMSRFGIKALRYDDEIVVMQGQEYKPVSYTVEADWSAAAFWYELAALNPGMSVKMNGLRKDSFQGDKVVAKFYQKLDVTTHFGDQHTSITSNQKQTKQPFNIDVSQSPDMFPALVATCFCQKRPFEISGTANLKIKESNRVDAMAKIAASLGVELKVGDDTVSCKRYPAKYPQRMEVDVCNDHRIAMAVAPLVGIVPEIQIDDPKVVSKSYPGFWDDMKNAGIILANG